MTWDIHFQACRDGCEKLVGELLSKKPWTVQTINELNEDGMAPIHYAARCNQSKIIQMLLDNGAGNDCGERAKADSTQEMALLWHIFLW